MEDDSDDSEDSGGHAEDQEERQATAAGSGSEEDQGANQTGDVGEDAAVAAPDEEGPRDGPSDSFIAAMRSEMRQRRCGAVEAYV